MKKTISDFVSNSDRERIMDAVEDAEKTTSGEIVPMIVPYCSTYSTATLRGALFLSFLCGLIAAVFLRNDSIYLFLPVFVIGIFVFYFLIDNINTIKRFFVFSKEIEVEVSEGALAAFYECGVHRTRDESGVLIFVSIFEKKIWILADRGINDKVDPHEWDDIVSNLSLGIKQKKQCEAVITAIAAVGDILSERFPAKEGADKPDNLIIN